MLIEPLSEQLYRHALVRQKLDQKFSWDNWTTVFICSLMLLLFFVEVRFVHGCDVIFVCLLLLSSFLLSFVVQTSTKR